MKLFREYEEKIIKALGILGAITVAVILIALLAKFAMKILAWAIVISAIMIGAGMIYLAICILIDFDEKFGLK